MLADESCAMWRPEHTGVLLIHGLTGSPTEMAPLAKALRRAGFRTAVPLLAGHGAGHRELLATTWQDWRDGLRRDLRDLAQACDDVVVVGLCVGGLLGALLAAENSYVRGLVCLSPDLGFRVPGPATPWTRFLLPIAFRVPWLRHHGYWTQKPPYGLKNPRLQQRIAQAIAASAQGQTQEFGTFRTYVGTMREMTRLSEAVRNSLARVRCPSRIIHSVEDSMFSIRNAMIVYQQLGSPRKELALITGCDHVITVDLRRDDVARRVTGFVTGLYGAEPADPCRRGVLSAESAQGAEAPAPEAGDEAYSCDIAPGLELALAEAQQRPDFLETIGRATDLGMDTRGVHSVVIRKGTSAQLVLAISEEADAQRPRPAAQLPQADDDAWQLARQAIDALAFGLQKRLTVRAECRLEEPVAMGPARRTVRREPERIAH